MIRKAASGVPALMCAASQVLRARRSARPLSPGPSREAMLWTLQAAPEMNLPPVVACSASRTISVYTARTGTTLEFRPPTPTASPPPGISAMSWGPDAASSVPLNPKPKAPAKVHMRAARCAGPGMTASSANRFSSRGEYGTAPAARPTSGRTGGHQPPGFTARPTRCSAERALCRQCLDLPAHTYATKWVTLWGCHTTSASSDPSVRYAQIASRAVAHKKLRATHTESGTAAATQTRTTAATTNHTAASSASSPAGCHTSSTARASALIIGALRRLTARLLRSATRTAAALPGSSRWDDLRFALDFG